MKSEDLTILAQFAMEEQGFCVVACTFGIAPERGEALPAGMVRIINQGDTVNVQLLCVGQASREEWVDQLKKYYPQGDTDAQPDWSYIKVVAE